MTRERWMPIALLLVLSACAVNPVTGRRELMLLSEADEIEIGRSNDVQVVATFGVYEEGTTAEWVAQIGHRIAAASERPHLPWTFRVLDDTTVNAFALPGGFVYLTRGILGYMNSEAEVVGVIGHEIGHVTARHSARQMSTASIAQLGLGLGRALSPQFEALSGPLSAGLGVLMLKFSRDDERQADRLGVRYAVRAGYDPRRLAAFFSTIERLTEPQGGALPTWLSTHPAPADREAEVLREAAPLVASRDELRVGRDAHLHRLEGMVFGPDPRQGVLVGSTFKHPELRFQIDYPADWKLDDTRRAVVAKPPTGGAAVVLTLLGSESSDLASTAREQVASRQGQILEEGDDSVAGLRAYRVVYTGEVSGEGPVHGVDLFVKYRGDVYDLAGLARRDAWASVANSVGDWQHSFRPLPLAEARRYRPDRIRLVRAPRAGPLQELLPPHSGLPIDELALLNGVRAHDTVAAGTLLKTIEVGVGTRR